MTQKDNINRRTFMAGCSACMAGLAALAHADTPLCTLSCKDLEPRVKAKVKLVFSHSDNTRPIWPNIGYDFEGRKKEITNKLRGACPEIEFEPITLKSQEQEKQLLSRAGEVDGYMCFILGLGPGLVSPRMIIDSGHPVILCDDLYGGSGRFLGEYGRARDKGLPVVGVSSSDIMDAARAANLFLAIRKLRHSKILDVTEREENKLWGGAKLEDFEKLFGTKIQLLGARDLDQAYKNADQDKAKAWCDHWCQNARQVIEPTKNEIQKSAAMYLGLQNLMKTHQAQAIAIDCLGLFYSDNMSAYPCLGFFQLNNDGLVGACESDLYSTITMLAMHYLTGQPGFISDPVFDTSKNQIIYAHCVAMSQVDGPNGRKNPYDIRDHSEDRKGAAVRSLMPLGETVTTLKFRPDLNLVVMHQGVTVDNIDNDKACRTKLAAEIKGDIRKTLDGWDYGWHRVTFYGDHKQTVEDFCTLKGIQVVHEA